MTFRSRACSLARAGNFGLGTPTQGQGVVMNDVYGKCGTQDTQCPTDAQCDATFLGSADDRTGNHEITLGGDAHCEADGVHFDGDGDYVSIPNFNYYNGAVSSSRVVHGGRVGRVAAPTSF
eukprot:SAG22_NODE_2592_length_2407_cov_1.497834_2_plen_121_part_00